MSTTVAGLRERLRSTLDATPDCDSDARLDAELLLSHVLGRARAWLIAHDRDPVAAASQVRVRELALRRQAGEPMAYLLGRREFWSLDLRVTPQVLIPRPDTERLVECALARLAPDDDVRVADLGTGSAAVALALARERPKAWVTASDASPGALAVAADNIRRLGNGRVALLRAHWLDALADEALDLVVSNPPYVADGDPHLSQGDVRFEPRAALTSGADGLDAIRHIASRAGRCLAHDGWLLLEHGADQGDAVRCVLSGNGFDTVTTYQDLGGRDRVTEGRYRRESRASG